MSWREQLRIRPGGLFELALLGALFGTVAGFLGGLAWWLDVFAHFRVQYVLVLGGAGLVQFLRRRPRRGLAWSLAALPNLVVVLPHYLPLAGDLGGATMRVMQVNVNTSMGEPRRVAEAIERYDPDVLLLMEVNDEWLLELEPGLAGWQRIVRTRADNFGIALFSRLSLRSGRVLMLGTAGVPSLECIVRVGEVDLRLIGTHPLPPYGGRGARLRDEQLAAVGRYVRELDGAVLLLGDLNTTSWSHGYRALERVSGLRDVSRGHGVQPTWPSLPWVLRIPLDGALAKGGVGVRGVFVGVAVGSDHRPLVMDLVVGV